MYSYIIIHIVMSKKIRRNKMKTKVAARGQITIPKALRERLGIRPGTVLDFREEEGHLIAVKVERFDPVDRIYGKLGRGRKTDVVIEKLRGHE